MRVACCSTLSWVATPCLGVVVVSRGSSMTGRRRLAMDLRRHRAEAGRTIEDVARHLECSPAKVSRMETGAVGIRVQDLRAVLELYQVDGREREELFALVRQARQRGWWHAFSDVVPPDSATFYGLEDGAATIGQHNTSLVPGLLQTPAYARALISSVPGVAPEVVERRVELRLRRQELLGRPEAPVLHVVLDEAVLCRLAGGVQVMAEQLDHLLQGAARPNVVMQVLPFDAGAHASVGVGYTVFGFGDPAVTPVVYGEQLSRNTYLDQPDEVAVYTAALADARRVAESPEMSHDLIALRARSLR